ncbi:sigma-70 family RNA polymerase sigma factor [Bordetella avium]|uniref:sigma-70 family RNA polymerase sigma factor n=1 Tax=Bordetella avium TaxID=521 RepID=UPI0002E42448|nr:sigma-70 family RNA polymerase sigma factor [Bordetella avium]SUV69403.1 RNA polymerase ECF family sigma factor [Bordetella avium]
MSVIPDKANASVDGLYRQHRSWLMGWLRRKLGGSDHAEDMAQDVFIRIIQGRKQVDVVQARAFLTTIARGMLIDHWRRAALEAAYRDYLASLPQVSEPGPEARIEVMQSLAVLDRMLAGLSPRAREAFMLSQIDGLTYPEIAVRLGVSVSSVQQYMVKAMSACYEVFHA